MVYADYFSYAVDMHKAAHLSFAGLPDIILSRDDETVDVDFNDAKARDVLRVLVNQARVTPQGITRSFSLFGHMEDSLVKLVEYAEKKYDDTIDNLLTKNGLQVFESFAQVLAEIGRTISQSNIKIR